MWWRVLARILFGGPVLRLALLLAAGCGETTPPAPAPAAAGDVLLITVDTLRADHVGLYGYSRPTTPELDGFFADGLIVERAYSTEANTSPSVVSILTGLLPQQHRVRLLYQLLAPEVSVIPDLLPEVYQSAAFIANVVLTDEAIGLAGRFDHYDDFIDERVEEAGGALYERSAGRTTDAALRWLARDRDPARPLFLWVHYIDPHAPYRPPEDTPARFDHPEPRPIDVSRLAGSVREPGVDDGLAYVDRYDEEIAYTDAQIGRLLRGYAETRPIDEALVLFTADHGESMIEHELWFAHGYHVYEEIVRVPLLLRGPGVPSARIPGPGSGIDIAPTVLAFAGAALPPDVGGIDLRRAGALTDDRRVFAEATSPLALIAPEQSAGQVGYWRAVVERERKWMMGLVRGEREVAEQRYYDLATDPAELAPLERGGAPSGAERELLELIAKDPDPGGLPEALRPGIRLDAPKVSPRASEAQRERLRALGYVE